MNYPSAKQCNYLDPDQRNKNVWFNDAFCPQISVISGSDTKSTRLHLPECFLRHQQDSMLSVTLCQLSQTETLVVVFKTCLNRKAFCNFAVALSKYSTHKLLSHWAYSLANTSSKTHTHASHQHWYTALGREQVFFSCMALMRTIFIHSTTVIQTQFQQLLGEFPPYTRFCNYISMIGKTDFKKGRNRLRIQVTIKFIKTIKICYL